MNVCQKLLNNQQTLNHYGQYFVKNLILSAFSFIDNKNELNIPCE